MVPTFCPWYHKKSHITVTAEAERYVAKNRCSLKPGYIQKNPHGFWMSFKTVVFYGKMKDLSMDLKKFIKSFRKR